MAAVLKKRVAAEFSQVIQEGGHQPLVKRLRLIYRSRPTDQPPDFISVLTSAEAFKILLELERSLPLDGDSLQAVLTSLFERLTNEGEPSIRAKIAYLIGQLSKSPSINALCLVGDIISFLKTEKSHLVVAQLISALLSIGRVYCSNSKLQRQLFECSLRHLDDSSHSVRCKCLELIGTLGSGSREISTEHQVVSPMSILTSFSQDSDSRVRTQAFQSMLMLHQRGIKLEQVMYSQVCDALRDDHEGVRLNALKLVRVFSLLYPEQVVMLPNSDESLRLVDDGFAKICNMVNDISVKVRAEAAALLGSLHNVSTQFLEQTLDKKLMSNMRLKRSSHERQKDYFESGEWATGQKWADDAPREDVDPDNISLISGGACGAFVHGLEDEYLEVRNAALDSLCELASYSPSFAKLSQDFLVDMFNDEIETVRLNAINSLRKICHHFLLREDQLEIILSVLKDFSFEIREALREMLGCSRVSTKECLSVLVLTLLDNLKRYPEDRQSVWKCMMNLGSQHQSLVLALAPDLLSSHLYFESLEPDADDPAYVGILILVFNAAAKSPTMLPLFPVHLHSHYTYLRNTLSDLVPRLQPPPDSCPNEVNVIKLNQNCESFLSQTLQRLQSLSSVDSEIAVRMLNTGIRDLRHVEQVEPQFAASAQCIAIFLHCQLMLHKAVSRARQPCVLYNFRDESVQQTAVVNKVQEFLLQMQNQYLGIGDVERAQMYQLHLRIMVLRTLIILQNDKTVSATVKQLACSNLLLCLIEVNKSFAKADLQPDQFTKALLVVLPTLKTCDPAVFQNVLVSLAGQNVLTVLNLKNQLQRTTAFIIEPLANSELILKFTAGLAISVNLVAIVKNIRHIDRLRIRVKYPDQQQHLLMPSISDFKQLSNLVYRLVTKVLLSHVFWTEPSPVQLSVVLLCPLDNSFTEPAFIELCPSVPVNLSPVPAKR